MPLKPTGSTEVIRSGTRWGQLHWCLAGLVGLAALAGTKRLLNCRNTKLVSLNSVCMIGIQLKLSLCEKGFHGPLSQVNPTNPSQPWSSSAGHTYSCTSKDCCSSEEQQKNNCCCCGQAHDGGFPDVDAASFLGVTLCEETHCLIYTKWEYHV